MFSTAHYSLKYSSSSIPNVVHTDSIDQHRQATQGGDCGCEMPLGIIKLFYVSTNLLNHVLRVLCLAPYLTDLGKQLHDLPLGID